MKYWFLSNVWGFCVGDCGHWGCEGEISYKFTNILDKHAVSIIGVEEHINQSGDMKHI
jgi:hypothetical protein